VTAPLQCDGWMSTQDPTQHTHTIESDGGCQTNSRSCVVGNYAHTNIRRILGN
jgi:hypothetical protein